MPGAEPGVRASTKWMMLSVRSWSPHEMKIFVPVISHRPSGRGVATDRIAPTSDPASGSVIHIVPAHSPVTSLGQIVVLLRLACPSASAARSRSGSAPDRATDPRSRRRTAPAGRRPPSGADHPRRARSAPRRHSIRHRRSAGRRRGSAGASRPGPWSDRAVTRSRRRSVGRGHDLGREPGELVDGHVDRSAVRRGRTAVDRSRARRRPAPGRPARPPAPRSHRCRPTGQPSSGSPRTPWRGPGRSTEKTHRGYS